MEKYSYEKAYNEAFDKIRPKAQMTSDQRIGNDKPTNDDYKNAEADFQNEQQVLLFKQLEDAITKASTREEKRAIFKSRLNCSEIDPEFEIEQKHRFQSHLNYLKKLKDDHVPLLGREGANLLLSNIDNLPDLNEWVGEIKHEQEIAYTKIKKHKTDLNKNGHLNLIIDIAIRKTDKDVFINWDSPDENEERILMLTRLSVVKITEDGVDVNWKWRLYAPHNHENIQMGIYRVITFKDDNKYQ